jgi:hypothetical protein
MECVSDVGCCMKPPKTIGDSQKNDTFFACACLRILWCGHGVSFGGVVFSRLDPLHLKNHLYDFTSFYFVVSHFYRPCIV